MILRFSQVVVLALLAGSLALPQDAGRGHMGRMAGGPGGRGDERMLQFTAKALDLNETQQAQAKSIFSAERSTSQPLHMQLSEGRKSMQAAISSGSLEQIDAIATSQGILQGKLEAIHAKSMVQFNALLTPDQKKKSEALHSMGRPGPGPGLALQ